MHRKINFWGLPTRIVQICNRSANFDEPRATTFAKYFPFLDIGDRKDWVGGHIYIRVSKIDLRSEGGPSLKLWWCTGSSFWCNFPHRLGICPDQHSWIFFSSSCVNFFKKTAGFLAKFLEIWNSLFYLVSLHTTFLQKVYEILHCHFNFNKKGPKSFILKFTLFHC